MGPFWKEEGVLVTWHKEIDVIFLVKVLDSVLHNIIFSKLERHGFDR